MPAAAWSHAKRLGAWAAGIGPMRGFGHPDKGTKPDKASKACRGLELPVLAMRQRGFVLSSKRPRVVELFRHRDTARRRHSCAQDTRLRRSAHG